MNADVVSVLGALGSVGQVLTAVAAAIVAIVAYDASRKFNKSQVLKFEVEHINQFNSHILQLAEKDRSLAERLGRPVLSDSDIVVDYINFVNLNTIHMLWHFSKNGVINYTDIDYSIRNAAEFIRPHGKDYTDAILARGYDREFAVQVQKTIDEIGGYPHPKVAIKRSRTRIAPV